MRRARARTSLVDFYRLFEPSFHLGDWLLDLAHEIESTDDWLLISAPVRHGKTQLISRMLPAFALGRDPKLEVVLVTATQELANGVGLYVRNLLNHPLYRELFPHSEIDPGSNSVSEIRLKAGGGFLAVGAGVQIVGRGAGLMVIDDIYKDRAQAANVREREKIWQYFTSGPRTRLSPTGRMLIMAQRWAPNDIVDALMEQGDSDPTADQYRHIVYRAVIETQKQADEDRLFRTIGDPLHPERWTAEKLAKARASIPEATWQAAYQQSPVSETGGFFNVPAMRYYTVLPSSPMTWYVPVDWAASVKSWADRTAITPFGLDAQRNMFFAPDYVYDKIDSLKGVEALIAFCKKYRPVGIISEKGPLDAAIRPLLNMAMRSTGVYVPVIEFSRSVAKHVIATPLAGRIQQGAVFFPDSPRFKHDVLPTFMQFQPDVDGEDDFIDAASMGAYYVGNAIAPSVLEAPPPDPDDDEAAWARITARTVVQSSIPFTRLNGVPFR